MARSLLSASVGARLRWLRENQLHVSQDAVAQAARLLGLAWSRTTVAGLEQGARGLTAEELLLLPVVLRQASGQGISLRDLLPGDVPLTPDVTLTRDGVEQLLGGKTPFLTQERAPGLQVSTLLDQRIQQAREVAQMSGHQLQHAQIRGWEELSEAESKVAKRLGLTVERLRAMARDLWGHSLVVEREQRLRAKYAAEWRAAGGPGGGTRYGESEREMQARRGHITRALTAELLAASGDEREESA